MAFLDPARDLIVVRLVYDGAAFAGKTSSLRSLAASLGRPLSTPEQIAQRTIYFDWLDYEGGVFEGRIIRCQLVSVPGQRSLAARRKMLIESADVVVFIGDSTAGRFSEALEYLAELRARLAGLPGPPVGIIFQANKRDSPEALPVEEIRRALGEAAEGVAIVETVATTGDGVRKAFVLAVRLALDRVREQQLRGELGVRPPEVDSGEELLRQIQALELSLERAEDAAPAAREEREEGEGGAGASRAPADRPRPPRPPGADVPAGLVWPPIEGRIALHQAEGPLAELEEGEAGEWRGRTSGGWRLQSPPASFPTLEAAREALVDWARLHSQAGPLLSRERCLASCLQEGGDWRLWQCVLEHPSLEVALERALRETRPEAAAGSLFRIALRLTVAAQGLRHAGVPLPATLGTIGAIGKQPLYIGMLPLEPPAAAPETRTRELLERQLAPRLADLAAGAAEVATLLERPGSDRPSWGEGAARELAALLRASA